VANLIPLLQDLIYETNLYEVSEGFVPFYVSLHEGDWLTAQDHWEIVVSRVLTTDTIDRNADGARALRQAVKASAILLAMPEWTNRCPMCPVPSRPASGGSRGDV
jgi:hypothetical protein